MSEKEPFSNSSTPVCRVPSEALKRIIWYTGPDEHDDSIEDRSHRLEVMLTSHVCSYFRSVALSMPALWSAGITYHFGLLCEARDLDWAATWLSRTGGHPLKISVDIGTRSLANITFTSVLDIILPYCSQWQNFAFESFESSIAAFAPIKGNVPLLEKLSLKFQEEESPSQSIAMFGEAPKLRDFTCQHGDLTSIVLPWAQLVHCDVGARPIAEYLAILPKLLTLVELKIELSFHDSAMPSNKLVVVLPRVTKLEIEMIPDPSALLNYLTLPSLADIRHDTRWTDPHSWSDTYSWDLSSVRSLISRSSCCITSLALPITLISIDEARVLFSLTPELTRLESNHYSDGSWALFERRKGTNQALLPKLKVLRMDFVRGTHVGPAFMKTIISRWALTPQERELGAVQLERFIYVVPTRLDQGDIRGHNHRCRFLMALQAQGLDVKVLEVNVDGPDDSEEEYLNYEYNYHSNDDDDESDTDGNSYEDDTDDEHDSSD